MDRKVTYRLYPKSAQEARMLETLELHRQLYNAALEERIGAWRSQKVSLSFQDQCRQLTVLRKECAEFSELNAQSCQVTLKRLDLAFQAFFRRVKAKAEQAGFPRFRSRDRFPGWGYKTHGDGWRLLAGAEGKHGALRLSGVGLIKLRGKARTQGEPKTCEIQRKNGRWYLSVTIECEPERQKGTSAIGLDWGLEKFATMVFDNGRTAAVENPRHVRKALGELTSAQKELSRKKRGTRTDGRPVNGLLLCTRRWPTDGKTSCISSRHRLSPWCI